VLGSFRLAARQLEAMQQLQVWTRCCECSVAAAVHDSLDWDVREALSSRLPDMTGDSGWSGGGSAWAE
jgi:hypothetical protein